MPDAHPDASNCTTGQKECAGRNLRSCGADAQWDPSQDIVCDFTCAAEGSAGAECVSASDITTQEIAVCGSGSVPVDLDPGSNGVITYGNNNGAQLTCSPSCNSTGSATINPFYKTTDTPGIAWFCLSSVNLQPGAKLVVATVGVPQNALGFVVDTTATIEGTIELDGFDAAPNVAGTGGPGGYSSGQQTNGPGSTGGGPTGGQGGQQGYDNCSLCNNNYIGGGGGGGGNLGSGAMGGSGENPDGQVGTGGAGGPSAGATLALVGGGGGGGAADAESGGGFGWPGGGGGGAFQISARASISMTGSISAHGGAGYGDGSGDSSVNGGGGGGGGGTIVLEAPNILLDPAAVFDVDGGSGGSAGAGSGGAGESGSNGPQPGTSAAVNANLGGAGGGGGGGRIVIHSAAASPTCKGAISPLNACTASGLVLDTEQ